MDSAGTMMQMGGLGMSIGGTLNQGKAAKDMAAYTAAQYRQRANLDVIAGQQDSINQAEKGRVVEGQARAIGAAQGGGGPSTTATIADIMQKTQRNQAGALWKGQVAATGDENAARAAIVGGENAARAANISAISQGLSGFGKFYAKNVYATKNNGVSILDDDNQWK
jgi:hypothetical protein